MLLYLFLLASITLYSVNLTFTVSTILTRGHCDLFQEPPNGFPYIPGGDISGVVVESDIKSRFKEGDEVMAMFELPRPLNGLSEFISVKEQLVEFTPKQGATLVEASALPSSALSALLAVKRHVKMGDRVLVLGGSGGVGTFLIQIAKNSNAFVAATSTDTELLATLGADKVINYQVSNWWEDEELLSSDPFDLIVDLAVGRDAWVKAKQSKLLKTSGKFLAFTSDTPLLEIHTYWQALKIVGRYEWRMMTTRLSPFSPRYIWHNGLGVNPGLLAEVAKMVEDGSVKVVLDRDSPLPFTEDGVKRGFHIMQKRSGHGKIVVSMDE